VAWQRHLATSKGKAPSTWFEVRLLARIEDVINSTYVSSIGTTLAMVKIGRESCAALAAACDWSSPEFGMVLFGLPILTFADVNELLAAHYAAIDAVQSCGA